MIGRARRRDRAAASPLLAAEAPFPDSWGRRVRTGLARRVWLDLGADPARTVFVAGSPRSGTTWLAEVINHDHRYRTIFEPFRPGRVRATGHFRSRQYLRPGAEDPALAGPIERVLTGRVRSGWTDQHNTRLVSTRRLVKDPWSNLFLGWIADRFPEVPIVLVLRHPCAVVHSQLAMGAWKWHVDLDDVLSQPDLVEDVLEPYLEVVRAAGTDFERHVALWCIENLVALRQLEGKRAFVVTYEDLCLRPAPVLGGLFGFLGRPLDDADLPRLDRPSALSRKDSAIATGASLVDGWRAHVDPATVRRADEMLEAFGLDGLYPERRSDHPAALS
jgi:hypothetical protein